MTTAVSSYYGLLAIFLHRTCFIMPMCDWTKLSITAQCTFLDFHGSKIHALLTTTRNFFQICWHESDFPCFRTAVKSVRLSRIARFLNSSNNNWKSIPNYYLAKHGVLSFLLNSNYDIECWDNRLPLFFYRERLQYFHDLPANYEAPLKRSFILWNNKDILNDMKTVSWKTWYDKNILLFRTY